MSNVIISDSPKKPAIYNLTPYYQAGIDPKTGLPVKMGPAVGEGWRKEAIKKSLRIVDEQDAVNRYTWYNLPCTISSQELERLLYYKGQLAFFYCEPLEEFYFMPYALDGGIDFYGRFKRIHPVPMAEGTETRDDPRNLEIAKQREYLSTLKLDVLYDVPLETDDLDVSKCCVLLHDYTKQLSETIISRQIINDPILDIMADCIPFMRTNLLNSTGIDGVRVNSSDEQSNVIAASAAINRAALNGEKYVPIIGMAEFQELTPGQVAKSEEYMLAMQSLDNYRLSLYGLDSGGLFNKKSHMLQSEMDMNSGTTGLVLQDGLAIRQRFCDIVNAITGLGISCEISETASGMDMNMDGLLSDEQDQSGQFAGGQPQEVSE